MVTWPFREKEPSSEVGEEGTKEGKEEEKKTPESSSETPPTDTQDGVEGPFTHPSLVGKSEQELADLLALSDLKDITIKEQKAAVDSIGNQPPTPAPEPEPPVDATSAEYFENPIGTTRKMIQEELKSIVAPLEAQFAKGFVKDAWEEVGEEIPNLAQMRPAIEAVLKRSGITNPTSAHIIGSYDMAVGQAARQGTVIPGVAPVDSDPSPKPEVENPRMIPQHAVSTQPIAETEKKVEFEPLNENEARLAREANLTHEKYRALQDMDEADILRPEPEKVS